MSPVEVPKIPPAQNVECSDRRREKKKGEGWQAPARRGRNSRSTQAFGRHQRRGENAGGWSGECVGGEERSHGKRGKLRRRVSLVGGDGKSKRRRIAKGKRAAKDAVERRGHRDARRERRGGRRGAEKGTFSS